MDKLFIVPEDRLEDTVYAAVSKVFGNFFDKQVVEGGMSKSNDEGFYDRDELCSFLHISYPTLWRIEQAGILNKQKVGKKNLYSKAEVNLLVKSGMLAKYNKKK